MTYLIKRVLTVAVLTAALITALVTGVLFLSPQFEDSYGYCIQRKFRQLAGRDEPAIVIVGDSGAAFGIDNELLSELCGYPVVNLGLQGSMGTKMLVNMVLENSVPGDIVVYAANDANWVEPEKGTERSRVAEVIEIALDGWPEGYRYMALDAWDECVTAFPAYACKKFDNFFAGEDRVTATGAYAITSFDETGNMILERKEWTLQETFDESWICSLERDKISDVCIEQVNAFGEALEKREAFFVVSYGPLLDTCIESTDLDAFEQGLSERLEFDVISEIEDYIYPIDLMYNSPLHCNERGSEMRTRSLAADINAWRERSFSDEF